LNLNGKIKGIITNSYIPLPAQIGDTFVRMRRTEKQYEPITNKHRFSLRCCEGIFPRFISL